MKRIFRKILVNILVCIFLIELIPFSNNTNNLFNKIEEAKAFSTQLDSIAPGYIIKAEMGGISFDLSDRITYTMTVESFSVKNADPNKRKNDKPEQMLDNLGIKWLSVDSFEHDNIYDVELEVYDSDLEKTLKFINSFKFTDKNEIFNPKIEISKLVINPSSQSCRVQDIIIDFKNCKKIIDDANKLKLDILNADLTKIDMDTITIDKDKLIKDNYKITLPYLSSLFRVNKDYIIRLYADNNNFDRIVSTVLKSNREIITTAVPNEIEFFYAKESKMLSFVPHRIHIHRDMRETTVLKLILSNSKKGLKPVESTGVITESLAFRVPDEYLGTLEPSDIKCIVSDKKTGRILYEQLFQISFRDSEINPNVWEGLEIFTSMDDTGYKIDEIQPFNNEYQHACPHSWDGFPKAHYVTLYDNTLRNQIGGEFRFDVINNKSEFLWKKHDVRGANFKIPYKDMKQGFNSYNFKVESSNTRKDWSYAYISFAFYADLIEFKSLDVTIKNLTPSNSSNGYDFSLFIENQDVITGEKMSIIDDNGKEYVATANGSKEFKFNDISLIFGGKYIVTYNNISSLIYFKSSDSSILFNPVIVGTLVDGSDGLEITLDEKLNSIMNSDTSKNKIKILHMNGNETKNIFTNINIGNNKFKLTENLLNGNRYIVEFSNGNEIYRSTFEYTPLRLNVQSASGTSVKLEWKYPNNYLIMENDILNIYFKKYGSDYSAVPDAKIMHGFQGIDFDQVRTYTIKELSPNLNYTAKLELITSQGTKFTSETEFVTGDFKIMNEKINGLSEDGTIESKIINLSWDINQADVEFSNNDRIDIFLKLKTHDVFPTTPVHTIREDVNRIKKATIEVPNYSDTYSVKIVYNIGGAKYSSNIIDFRVESPKLEAEISEIVACSSKLSWKYPENLVVTNQHRLKVYYKKSNDMEYKEVFYLDNKYNSFLSNTSYVFSNLQSNTDYIAKIEFKVGEREVAGVKEDVKQVIEIPFKTKKLGLQNFRVEKLGGLKVKVKWDLSDKSYKYRYGDKVEVYVKDKQASEYPAAPRVSVHHLKDELEHLSEVELYVWSYNKSYDVKVVYVMGLIEEPGYVSFSMDLGKMDFIMESITDNSIKVKWSYPEGYSIYNGDRLDLSVKPKDGSGDAITVTKSGKGELESFVEHEFTNLTTNKEYILSLDFKPEKADLIHKEYTFVCKSGLQILSLESMVINSSSVNLKWNNYNNGVELGSSDKLEIFVKEKSNGNNGDFNDVKAVFEKVGDIKDITTYTVTNLDVNKEYVFRVKYTFNNNSGNPVYRDVVGKPELVKFNASVVDTNVMGVKLEIIYPEGYEKVKGDILDIYIKPYKSENYNANPNFSAIHGDEEGQVDLNEITLLDIFGLAPGGEYKAKVVLWPDGGNSHKIEKEITFKTNEISGIQEAKVLEVMDHVVKVGIRLDSENIIYSNDDACKVYIKKKTEENYPKEPNGESLSSALNEEQSVSAYFDELNTEYDLKVVVTIGGVNFEKVIDFTSKVDDINVAVKEFNPMTAQIEWKYPSNYTLIDGESVKIFIKYKDEEDFLETPDLELIQSDELDLSNINLIELSALVPDTEYDVKLELNLLEVQIPSNSVSFRTTGFEIQDLNVKGVSGNNIAIGWRLDKEGLEFIDNYDNLAVFIKGPDEAEYDFSKPAVEHISNLSEIRTASFSVDSDMDSFDILLSYLIEDYEAFAEIKFGTIGLYVEDTDEGVLISWEYPSNLVLENDDRLDIYLKDAYASSYDKDPIFRYVHGKDGNLEEVTEIILEDIPQGDYKLKFLLITQENNYDPFEIEFTTGEIGDAIKLSVKEKATNRGIIISNEGIDIDYSRLIKVTPDGLNVEEVEGGEYFMVTNLVPGKEYDSIVINADTIDGENVVLMVNDVLIEPETLLEEFVTNIYIFAFERYPDENGYSYWLEKLMEKKDITGKYVLYNLMFAEREFSDRNLADEELIKVLYQIVVNREADQEGLEFWINEYNTVYLPQANGDSYEAQKAIVTRMLHEQEFKNLCEKMGILW